MVSKFLGGRALQYPVVSTQTGCLFWPPKELSRKSHPSEGAIETFHPANEGRVWGTLHSVIWYLHIPTMVDWFLNHFTTASPCDWSLWWLQKFLVLPGMIGAPVIPSFWLAKKWWGRDVSGAGWWFQIWVWVKIKDLGDHRWLSLFYSSMLTCINHPIIVAANFDP